LFLLAALVAGVITGVSCSAKPAETGQRADPQFDTTIAHPAYPDTHPIVLFDEAHNNFHTTFGRYRVFADLMRYDGYRIVPNEQPFTADTLQNAAVLVIANAVNASDMRDSAFTEAECQAVQDFVDQGGSLLLITDHQPFGTAAATLAGRFGVDMSEGVASDTANETKDGLLFGRDKGLVADHPVTLGRDESEKVNRVLTFTGQSLIGPPDSIAFVKFADTAVDTLGPGQERSARGRAQGIAFQHGKGRVVVLGEAAELSAQIYGSEPVGRMGMNVPGCDNRQMALNIMHWLSGLLN
jgi:hypothetical protein